MSHTRLQNKNGETDPRVRWLLAIILAVGFLLRLTYLLEVTRAPDFAAPQFESQYHDYWARALVTGDWTPPEGVTDPEIPRRPFFRPPGYPYFLALIYQLFGLGYLWPRALQMLLGLFSCGAVFALARRFYGDASGLFAATLTAVYWIFIFFEAEFMALPLLILLLLLTLWTVAFWTEAFTVRRALGAGLLLGIAAQVRPNVLVLPPVFLLWAAWLEWRRGRRLGTGFLRPALTFAAAVALTVVPSTVRNVRVAGDGIPITSNGGINLFVGTHPDSDGYTPAVPELGEMTGLTGWDSFDYPKIAAAVEHLLGRPLKDSEVSRFFTRRALRHIFENPWDVFRLTVRKLALFWGPAEVSNNKVIYYDRQNSPTLLLSPDFATVLALALAGLVVLVHELRRSSVGRAIARRPDERGPKLEVTVLLLIFLVVYSASFLPFFVAARFRVPIIPVLILFAGFFLGWLWRVIRARQIRQLGIAVVLLVALRAVTGIAWIDYEYDQALWHWRKGLLYQDQGDLARAISEFRQTLVLEPDHDEAHLALAGALAAGERPAEAIAEYQAALALKPESIAAHNNLAMLLARQGDMASAVRHWSAALGLDPDRVSVLNNLAFTLATHHDPSVRDVDRAVELAERACRLTGYRDPRLLATLAAAYRAAGREAEAQEILRRASESG